MRLYWPLSVRQIHYKLLNNPPLIHAKKPGSGYQNTKQSYKALTDLLCRARLAGQVGMHCIADETRPITLWRAHQSVTPFLREELKGFLKGYYRDLQQSQPNHIEILGEKNTIQGVIKPVAGEYTLPLTIGRGYSSLPPRYEMAERYWNSGKENLILLVLSDFDPDGEEICHSFARSMRDDFNVDNIQAIKVGLTYQQTRTMRLPESLEAKEKSANYSKFVSKYGRKTYELESVSPDLLQDILRDAIDSVMDLDLYNAEISAEKEDAAMMTQQRQMVYQLLKDEALLGDGFDIDAEEAGEEEAEDFDPYPDDLDDPEDEEED